MSQLHLQPVVPSVGPTAGLAQASETPTEAAAPDEAASQPPVVQLACQRVAQSVEQHVVPIAPAEAVGLVGVDATTQEGACSPDAGIADSRDEAEPLRDRLIGRWAVLHGLQKSAHLNGRLVRVGSRLANGRFETVRPGSGDQLAVRPEKLRGLLEKYYSIMHVLVGTRWLSTTACSSFSDLIPRRRFGRVRKRTYIYGSPRDTSDDAAVRLCSKSIFA